MTEGRREAVTDLLHRRREGEDEAIDELMQAVHPELHQLAPRYLRGEYRDHTLQPTALERLAELDERKSRVVELRFFGGLTYDEAAEAVGVSVATLNRELRFAKAWLANDMQRNAV